MEPGSSNQAPLVLLVDDFEDAREMYEEYLSYRGYRIAGADSGEAALIIARQDTPAVILMDIEMRGMSGGDTLRLLRADPTLCAVPVIAFTAHALAHELAAVMMEGFDAVIAKPCMPEDLIALIEPYLEKHRAPN